MEQTSSNALNIDSGLIETLNIRLNDVSITPDPLWFESICKYIYEKIKNEDIFLANFYRSSAYRKLLLELEFYSNFNVDGEIDSTTATQLLNQCGIGSDSNSGDLAYDDEIDFIALDGNGSEFLTINAGQKISPKHQTKGLEPLENQCVELAKTPDTNLLDVIGTGVSKHYRSHSDCTGIVQNIDDIHIEPLGKNANISPVHDWNRNKSDNEGSPRHMARIDNQSEKVTLICPQHRLSAKIINTAICEGQFAVYAIQVTIIEENQQKSWHVYRRYSRFLDLKKVLVKRVWFFILTNLCNCLHCKCVENLLNQKKKLCHFKFQFPSISQIPFPAKKTFQNTQRSVLEHRMTLLNEFLKTISMRADDNDELHSILRDFLEPDTNDKKIHGGAVIRTVILHTFS